MNPPEPRTAPALAPGAFRTRPAQFERPAAARAARERAAQEVVETLSKRGAATGTALCAALEAAGLETGDPRLSGTRKAFAGGGALTAETLAEALPAEEAQLVRAALTGRLVAGDFQGFRGRIANLFHHAAGETSGDVARYIPELAKADPDAFSLGCCTIDGQRFELGLREGDAARSFCVQSAMKPLNYALALELMGQNTVHAHVGREPSGQGFNEITLNAYGRPHNPMINAGAILTAALIRPGCTVEERFDLIVRLWRAAAGGDAPGFDAEVFESERRHADRNFALAYFMREHGCFPEDSDMHAALELYFRCCAITTDVRRLSAVAATLANGGVCPVTERQVVSRESVKAVLSLMLSCGMYDFSGEYAFTVGLPAKSGVSGALMIVAPGVCGFALYSPRLGVQGNPERGVEFSKRLVEAFPWHVYAPIVAGT
ncbi:glutaminase A [Maricaulaceae bacterium MS644]